MKLTGSSLSVIKLPYPRPVKWKDTVEDGTVFGLLRLRTAEGLEGVAEGTIRPTWNGASPGSLRAAIDEIFLPMLRDVPIDDPATVRRVLSSVPDNRLAKAMIDNACWDLRARAAGKPLWRLWNGPGVLPISWTVTREAPAKMAAEAVDMIDRHGFRTLKIKGGQGIDIDRAAIRAIRAAVGAAVPLYVDANAAYTVEETPVYLRMLADEGSTHAEDPCDMRPNAWFRETNRSSPLPLLVDTRCTSPEDAELFLEQGAKAIGIKPPRMGATAALAIARMAEAAGCDVHVGLNSESALGTLASLQVAAAFPRRAGTLPAEPSFFLTIAGTILDRKLEIRDGTIALPDEPGLAALVDWKAVARYAA
jgi:L-alanine-DL-glutamate epimerase-like enolase superfamily enzyme